MNYVHCKHLTRRIRSGHDRALKKMQRASTWSKKTSCRNLKRNDKPTSTSLWEISKIQIRLRNVRMQASRFLNLHSGISFCFLHTIFWLTLHRLSPHTFAFAVGLCQGIEVAKAMQEEKLVFNVETQEWHHLLHLKHDRSTWEDIGRQGKSSSKWNSSAGKCIGSGLKLEAQKKCKFIFANENAMEWSLHAHCLDVANLSQPGDALLQVLSGFTPTHRSQGQGQR